MRLLQSADAAKLAGLSAHQLREWCVRRRILPPDVLPDGPGRHALYSWQTILVLRLIDELRARFGAEVGAIAGAAQMLRGALDGRAFQSLWGGLAIFQDGSNASFVERGREGKGPGMYLLLDDHLVAIATTLELPRPSDQLYLFKAVMVTG